METRGLDLEGNKIRVDNTVFSPELDKFQSWAVNELLYQPCQYDLTDNVSQKPIWSAKLPPEEFQKTPIWPELAAGLEKHFPYDAVRLEQVYVLISSFGDEHFYHKDAATEAGTRSVTSVTYLNKDWHPDWGGETLFENQGDCVFAVLPSYGRTVFFDHNISHTTRSPTVSCPERRYVLVCKYALR